MTKKADMPLVAARVPQEIFTLIEMGILFEGSSMQQVVSPVIVKLAEEFRSQPEIREALDLRERYQKRTRGKVVPIGSTKISS
jgi:hypothetical protein